METEGGRDRYIHVEGNHFAQRWFEVASCYPGIPRGDATDAGLERAAVAGGKDGL